MGKGGSSQNKNMWGKDMGEMVGRGSEENYSTAVLKDIRLISERLLRYIDRRATIIAVQIVICVACVN